MTSVVDFTSYPDQLNMLQSQYLKKNGIQYIIISIFKKKHLIYIIF